MLVDHSPRILPLTPRNSNAVESITKINDLLTCPACKTIMKPPIYTCKNIHLICSQCSPAQCTICNEAVTQTRHGVIETIAEVLLRPCKYALDGCLYESTLDALRGHEKVCMCKPLGCFKCSWSSNVRLEHIKHMKEQHGYETEEISLSKSFRIDLSESGDQNNTVCNRILELRSGDIFILESERRISSLYFSVRFLSRTDKVYQKSKYDRSILLANDEWKYKKFLWHGFATKLSQELAQSLPLPLSLSSSDITNCSTTKLERGRRVSESTWELVWNIKNLSINGFVNVID